MDGIFFLILSFLTIYFSTRLSYYGDLYSKQSKVGSLFVGGILIASITSLPELITTISATILNNPSLSLGDILGSNFFNIFVLAVYNLYFFKKNIFKNTSKKYIFECLLLIISYLFILLGSKNILTFLISTILLICYITYLYSIFKNPTREDTTSFDKQKFILLKFFITAIFMIILSTLLTIEADKITRIYPNFSSSTIGAILLGITTSLPEVVTTFSLLSIDNYNMAISNMLGSNIFNFLVLSISDFLYKGNYIYYPVDKYSVMFIYGGLFITFLFIITLLFKNRKNIFYFIISIIMSFSYLYVWYLQFH